MQKLLIPALVAAMSSLVASYAHPMQMPLALERKHVNTGKRKIRPACKNGGHKRNLRASLHDGKQYKQVKA